MALLLGMTAACSPGAHPVASAPAQSPALTGTPPVSADPTLLRAGPALPQPVNIPEDPYAPEPVLEIGTMEIPAIGLVHHIFEGVTLNNIDRGPSHWPGSAMPGQLGNAVFAGHRVTRSHPFRDIDALRPGDAVLFTIAGARTAYRVTGHLIVSPADSWIADQTAAYTATLYACHPPGSADERYVVRLELVT